MTAPRLAVAVQNAASAAPVPSRASIRKWVAAALRGARGEVTVRIVAADESAALNLRYRRRRGATNVLSFPGSADAPVPAAELAPLGDLVVCAEVVEREAREQNKTLDAHWAHIVMHGALHLIGFDHLTAAESETMEQRERELLAKFGFPDPYVPST
jgi:probable rRNA maturation factor